MDLFSPFLVASRKLLILVSSDVPRRYLAIVFSEDCAFLFSALSYVALVKMNYTLPLN